MRAYIRPWWLDAVFVGQSNRGVRSESLILAKAPQMRYAGNPAATTINKVRHLETTSSAQSARSPIHDGESTTNAASNPIARIATTRARIDGGGLLSYCVDVGADRLGDLLQRHKMPKQRSTIKTESNSARWA